MKYPYFLIVVLLLNSCNGFLSNKPYRRSEHSKIAARVTSSIAQKIEAETGLQLIGVGGGMMNRVRMMAMSFEQFGEINILEGRKLLIYCVNEYLSAINADEEIRPYLAHYPFTPGDIQIRIFIRKKDRREVSIGSIAVATAIEGLLDYDIKQPGLPSIKQIHEESYEEAVKMLETEGSVVKIRQNSRPDTRL